MVPIEPGAGPVRWPGTWLPPRDLAWPAVAVVAVLVVGVLTVVPGRATLLQGGVHLALFGAFLFLAISP